MTRTLSAFVLGIATFFVALPVSAVVDSEEAKALMEAANGCHLDKIIEYDDNVSDAMTVASTAISLCSDLTDQIVEFGIRDGDFSDTPDIRAALRGGYEKSVVKRVAGYVLRYRAARRDITE